MQSRHENLSSSMFDAPRPRDAKLERVNFLSFQIFDSGELFASELFGAQQLVELCVHGNIPATVIFFPQPLAIKDHLRQRDRGDGERGRKNVRRKA